MSVIVVAHTGVNPRTVVVHLHDTPATPPAVVRPRSLVPLAGIAPLHLANISLSTGPRTASLSLGHWTPTSRQEARASGQRAEEVEQSQAGET